MKNLKRHGTSLLEVMFALGVAVIGLLGVASLVTVSGYRLGEAKKADSAAALMREAIERFSVEGYNVHDYRFADGSPFEPPLTNGVRVAVPFCFDPLMAAGPVMDDGTPQLAGTFPHHGPAGYLMPRVGPGWMFEDPDGSPIPQTVREMLASEIARSRDDLIFERPTDRTLAPVAMISRNATGRPVRRQYLGEYSWFATLVPIDQSTDQYTLSVVVCHQRSPYLGDENESAYPVRLLYDAENNGGSAVLRDVPAEQKFRGGETWLFLRQHGSYRASWYRATIDREPLTDEQVALDPLLVAGDEGGRSVRLMGADWPMVPGVVDSVAVWVKGVVLVGERTVTIKDRKYLFHFDPDNP